MWWVKLRFQDIRFNDEIGIACWNHYEDFEVGTNI